MTGSLPHRFDAGRHEYTALDTGERLPHITGLLEEAGLIDSRFYTEASRIRGTAVHNLTAEYDLGALDVKSRPSLYRPWLLAHVKAMDQLQPEIIDVETTIAHPRIRFAGRPDRVLRMFGVLSVLEIKSGGPEKAHAIQTALQAMLASVAHDLPAEMFGRFALYLRETGGFSVVEFKDVGDFREARRVIRQCGLCV